MYNPWQARALKKRDLTARDAGTRSRDASPAAGHWLAPHVVQVAATATRRHSSGRRIGGPSAKIQHLRTSTSAIEGLTKMARAASVLSAWRSSQMSARRSEFRGARQKNRRFSDVSARQKGAGRLETASSRRCRGPLGEGRMPASAWRGLYQASERSGATELGTELGEVGGEEAWADRF